MHSAFCSASNYSSGDGGHPVSEGDDGAAVVVFIYYFQMLLTKVSDSSSLLLVLVLCKVYEALFTPLYHVQWSEV